MTADNYQNIPDEENQIASSLNDKMERLFHVSVLSMFVFWINAMILAILDQTGYTQNCLPMAAFLQSAPMLAMVLTVIFMTLTRRNIVLLYTSVLVSSTTSLIIYFMIRSSAWSSDSIRDGCDYFTEIMKGIAGLMTAILTFRICSHNIRGELVIE